MIQRFQSIFLAIVAIGMGLVGTMDIWSKVAAKSQETALLNATLLEHTKNGANVASTPTYYILGLAVIATVIAIYSLVSFKNRKLQLLLGAINSMVIASAMGFIFYYIFSKAMPLFEADIEGKYGIGFYAGGIALLANMISNRFIRRDENLVRSADRMR